MFLFEHVVLHFLHISIITVTEALSPFALTTGISNPSTQVSAQPASINELAEYAADPRTPDKLVDGVNMTCDDLHVWLAPYAKGTLNRISVSLDTAQELGMLRVWNYNKNRIHSQRGARHVSVVQCGWVNKRKQCNDYFPVKINSPLLSSASLLH
jgi:hypothetical protein